jgi:hypothetical protein
MAEPSLYAYFAFQKCNHFASVILGFRGRDKNKYKIASCIIRTSKQNREAITSRKGLSAHPNAYTGKAENIN